MIHSRRSLTELDGVPIYNGYPHAHDVGGKMSAGHVMATAPVGQITMDDDDDTIVVSSGSFGNGFYGGGSSGLSHSGGSTPTINGSLISSNSIGSMVGQLTLDLTVNQDPDLPGIVFNGYDFDEKKIVMTLQPESTISTLEVFKIMLLINAATHTPHKFSVFAYIKKNNLERHFKFAQ